MKGTEEKKESNIDLIERAAQHNLIGFYLYNIGRYNEALEEFNQSLYLYLDLNITQEILNVSSNVISTLVILNIGEEIPKVMSLLYAKKEQYIDSVNFGDAIIILQHTSGIYDNLQQLQDKISVEEEIFVLQKAVNPDRLETALSATRCAMVYENLGNYEVADL